MAKYAAILEYDGTGFHGWQSQPHCRNVQDCVADALSKVGDHPIQIICAGRTDTGVHACGQVIHFISDAKRDIDDWRRGTNAHLPEDIVVKYVRRVHSDFHARFSALLRSYRYIVLNSRERPVLGRHFLVWLCSPLDAERMHRAAQVLLGEHDFSAFRAAGCQSKSPVRHVSHISVSQHGELIFFDITANAFVQHMVRNIVGTLLSIGSGEEPESSVATVLACKDRKCAGVTAPGHGLYLHRVGYEASHGLNFENKENFDFTATLPELSISA